MKNLIFLIIILKCSISYCQFTLNDGKYVPVLGMSKYLKKGSTISVDGIVIGTLTEDVNPDSIPVLDGSGGISKWVSVASASTHSTYELIDSLAALDSVSLRGTYLIADSVIAASGNSYADFTFAPDYLLQPIDKEYEFTMKNSRLRPLVHSNNISKRLENNVEATERNFLYLYNNYKELNRVYRYILKLEKRIKKLEK
jgi:hypothetical protein